MATSLNEELARIQGAFRLIVTGGDEIDAPTLAIMRASFYAGATAVQSILHGAVRDSQLKPLSRETFDAQKAFMALQMALESVDEQLKAENKDRLKRLWENRSTG